MTAKKLTTNNSQQKHSIRLNGSGRLPFEQKTRVRFPYRVHESEKVNGEFCSASEF